MVERVFVSRHQVLVAGLSPRYVRYLALAYLQGRYHLVLRLPYHLIGLVELSLREGPLLYCCHLGLLLGEDMECFREGREERVEVTSYYYLILWTFLLEFYHSLFQLFDLLSISICLGTEVGVDEDVFLDYEE